MTLCGGPDRRAAERPWRLDLRDLVERMAVRADQPPDEGSGWRQTAHWSVIGLTMSAMSNRPDSATNNPATT